MPASDPVPKIEDFRKAARESITGYRDARASVRTGGGYDFSQGPTAILFARQAKRDAELFRRCYVETSSGPDRDRLVEAYYRVERTEQTYGTGYVTLRRPSAPGAGTVYAGTPIEVLVPGRPPEVYYATGDTPFTTELDLGPIPVRAARSGSGVAVVATAGSLRFGDGASQLSAVRFEPIYLICDNGTDYERDDAYLARAQSGQRDNRVGHLKRIIKACKDAGAYHVVALHSGTFGPAADFGINHVYVADAAFISSAAMLANCAVALEAVRVAGCDTQVLGMVQRLTTVTAAVTLTNDPASLNLVELGSLIRAALVEEFMGRSNWWIFRLDELRGAIQQASELVLSANVATSPGEPVAAFPAQLTRYTLAANDIDLTFEAQA